MNDRFVLIKIAEKLLPNPNEYEGGRFTAKLDNNSNGSIIIEFQKCQVTKEKISLCFLNAEEHGAIELKWIPLELFPDKFPLETIEDFRKEELLNEYLLK